MKAIAIATILLVAVVAAIAISRANSSSDDSASQDDTPTTYTEDYADETSTTLDACHDDAASIMGELDSGASATQVYADFGGLQNPQTQRFIRLYYEFQARAVQIGFDDATDELVDAIDAECG